MPSLNVLGFSPSCDEPIARKNRFIEDGQLIEVRGENIR